MDRGAFRWDSRNSVTSSADELEEAGFPKEEAFRAILFGTAVYLEKGAATVEDQMRFLNANDRESLVGMDNALIAFWKTVHAAAY